MNRIAKIIAGAILAGAVFGFGYATGTGHTAVVEHTTTVVQTAADVTSFNDGFRDAMRDNCDQGSVYACTWIATTK